MTMLRSCLLLFAVLAFAGPAAAASSDEGAAPADPAFETMMSRGDVLLAGGDDAGAEQAFRAALQLGPGGAARADALHKLGIALAHQEKYAEAEPVIGEAEQIARAVRGGNSVLLADVLRAKTVVLYRTGRVEEARAAFREAKRILEDNADVWETASDGGTWRHTPSGWRFAAEIGPFARLRRTMLDDSGRNVVIHYRIGPGGPGATLVSVYISVDRGVPLAAEFDATTTEIIRRYPDSAEIARGTARIGGFDGYRAALALPAAADRPARHTSLAAFARGRTIARFRATYPAGEAAKRAPAVAALIRAVLGAAPP